MTTTTMNPLNNCMDELKFLIGCKYGKNNVGRINSEQLARDVMPILQGDFTSICYTENKYKFLNKVYNEKKNKWLKTPLELRRLSDTTTSFMVDTSCYYCQVYNCIKRIRSIIHKDSVSKKYL